MSWYNKAVFYHIYPLGLCGAPQYNEYAEPVHRLRKLDEWISHIADLGVNALYIGPLFESVGHGYETTDYRKLDSRLGDNEDLKELVRKCHEKNIRVIFDAVFNHTGRDFFAFQDIRENRENSRYRDWYQNVNFWGNNQYNDGFSYDTWGGYDLLAKLNLRNEEVRNYHLETVRYWIDEFDVDGLRLDAADVLDFDFMKLLRQKTSEMKEDFFLLGEVIHGEYSRWVNPYTLHSVTNYQLHKALYSAHNDHNYFEIAHTIKRQAGMVGNDLYSLYNFADNHDVERIASRLRDRAELFPVYVLLYTLPGIPSIYYGSEFAVEGRKERYSDASLRPCLDLAALKAGDSFYPELVRKLGEIRRSEDALAWGEYSEVSLTTELYVFRRGDILVAANNSGRPQTVRISSQGSYTGALSGRRIRDDHDALCFEMDACSAEIWIPDQGERVKYEPVTVPQPVKAEEKKAEETKADAGIKPGIADKPYEEMSIEELQAAILAKMAANGPLNDRMIRDVEENIYRDSLLNWVRSFR